MSDQIPAWAIQDYKMNIELLLQQEDSRFMPGVTTDTYQGTGGRPVVQIGKVNVRKKTARAEPSPEMNTPHSARWVEPDDYDVGDFVDPQDLLRVAPDPRNTYVQAFKAGLERSKDDAIINAIFGTAKFGANGGSSVSFPTSTQQISVGSPVVGLTVAKLLTAQEILMAAELDLDRDPIYCAISAKQNTNLYKETQIISRDYNMGTPLWEGGLLRKWGIFNFIHSERLLVDGSSYRRVPCWAKSGMHFGRWGGVVVKEAERADRSFSNYIYVAGSYGATRLQELKTVEILCSEA